MTTKIQNEITELFNSEKAALHKFLTRYLLDSQLIEDLVQETFIKAYEKAGDLVEPYNLKAWLYKIAENSARNCYNRTKRADNLHEEIAEQSDSAPAHNYDYALQAMATLKPALRNTARLKYLYDYSIEEISANLKIPTGTVKRQLFDAREFIKKEIELMQNNETKLNRIAPVIEITEHPGENLKIAMQGSIDGFNTILKSGEIEISCEYTLPGGLLNRISVSEVKGEKIVGGKKYIQVVTNDSKDDKKIQRYVNYYEKTDQGWSNDICIYDFIDDIELEICYDNFSPLELDSQNPPSGEKMDVVLLKINGVDYGKCIRRSHHEDEGSMNAFFEDYITLEGRKILDMLYCPPQRKLYDKLEKERKAFHEGVEYRLYNIWVVEEVRQAE